MNPRLLVPIAVLLGAWLATAALFANTWTTMVGQWIGSDTFTHGFLILPICLWLIWQRRATIAVLPATPFWPAIAVMIAIGFFWLLGEFAGVNTLSQFAAVAMLPALALLVFGWRLSWQLVLPLAFLFFMVPAGDFLEAPMMEWTADVTIAALRASGIPVYREGLFFTIPSGRWSVVEACSGLRYLIAAVVLGTIFAYVTYRSLRKRLAFIAAAILLAFVGNWARAYLIVMTGHLSGMTLAVGVDHIFFGWVFFGIVIGAAFAIGARWRDVNPFRDAPGEGTLPVAGSFPTARLGRIVAAALVGVVVLAAWRPIAATVLDATTVRAVEPALRAALALEGEARWIAHYQGARQNVSGRMGSAGEAVDVQVAYYARQQEPGAEMITYSNRLVGIDERIWRVVRNGAASTGSHPVRETELASHLGRRLVWSWYVIDDQPMTSEVIGKLRSAAALLRGHGDHAAFVAVSIPIGDGAEGIASARSQLAAQAPRVSTAVIAALAPR